MAFVFDKFYFIAKLPDGTTIQEANPNLSPVVNFTYTDATGERVTQTGTPDATGECCFADIPLTENEIEYTITYLGSIYTGSATIANNVVINLSSKGIDGELSFLQTGRTWGHLHCYYDIGLISLPGELSFDLIGTVQAALISADNSSLTFNSGKINMSAETISDEIGSGEDAIPLSLQTGGFHFEATSTEYWPLGSTPENPVYVPVSWHFVGSLDENGNATNTTCFVSEMVYVVNMSGEFGVDAWYSSSTQETVAPTLLPQVAKPTWADKVVTWKDVNNINIGSYKVRLYNANAEALDFKIVAPGVQRYDYTDLIENYLPAGSYQATVQALPEGV